MREALMYVYRALLLLSGWNVMETSMPSARRPEFGHFGDGNFEPSGFYLRNAWELEAHILHA